MNSNIINKKSNLLNALMVATAIWGISESVEARSSRLAESTWIPSSMSVAASDDVSDLLTEDIVPDGLYYIRNSEAGTFFAGANAWGTRLSLKSAGDKIELIRKTGSNGYIFRDASVRGGNTGVQIGEPNGDPQIFIDQISPAGGFKFHKLTAAEVKAIDDEYGTGFGEGVGKDYFFIYYTNFRGETVFLARDVPGESNNSQVSGKDINDEDAQVKNFVWELFTDEELAGDLYDNATRDFFMSATPFLDNPDFSRNLNKNGYPNTNGWTIVDGLSNIWGENYNFIAAAENKRMNIYQTLTTIPNGDYGVVAYAVYDGAPSASDVYVPTLYVQDAAKKQSKMFKHVDQKYDMPTWSRNFVSTDESMLKQYRLDTIYVSVWDNTLTIGFEGGGNGISAYFDNVQLLYYGMQKDITFLSQKYSEVCKQGKSILDANKQMGAEYKQTLQAAVNDAPDFSDPKSIADAIVNITKAITAANKSVSLYGEIASKYDAEVSKLGADAQNLYNEKVRKPIVEAGLLTDEEQLLFGLNAAKIFDRGKEADVTDLVIVNPSFETGDFTGWTYVDVGVDTGIRSTGTNPYTMTGSHGSWLYNTWDGGAGGPISQTLKGLAPGTYTLTAVMASTRNSDEDFRYLHLNAGDATTMQESQHENTGVPMSITFSVDNISEVKITAWASVEATAVLSGNDQSWFKVDNFRLIYNEPKEFPEIQNEFTVELGNITDESSNTSAAPDVRNDESGESVYVFKPADEKKDQTITITIPIGVIVAGTTYKIVINLYPVFEASGRPNYLSFGLKGNGSKVSDRYYAPGEAGEYALGKYVYANDKEMKLEYEFTATQDMQAPVFVIKTETPVGAVDESTRSVGLKGISFVSETSSTAIETTHTEKEVNPISIYNISGVKVSSFQKGINVVRFSDGSIKKVFK